MGFLLFIVLIVIGLLIKQAYDERGKADLDKYIVDNKLDKLDFFEEKKSIFKVNRDFAPNDLRCPKCGYGVFLRSEFGSGSSCTYCNFKRHGLHKTEV